MHSKTAILIFANSAEKESVLKPFQFSKHVFNTLNKQTVNIARQSNLPYFVFSEKQQVGTNFGERFTNAIASIYEKGFESVISIGNDTPHLTTNHILKTVDSLQKHNVVLGPSTDGGFYLIGLKKSHFNAETFLKLPWQKSNLNQSIFKLIGCEEASISYLETLSDIDSISDIKTIVDSYKNISKLIKELLLKYISIQKKIINRISFFIENLILKQQFNKGSPSYI